MSDLRQSPQYARYIEKIGWRVETIHNINVFIRRLGILGSIAKIQRANIPVDFPEIPGVWMTKLEPRTQNLVPPRFRQDNWPLLATRTLRVDLTPPLTKIMASFKKDCRYSIRKCKVQNAKCKINEFDNFYELWKKAAKIKRLWVPPKWQYDALIKSFGQKALCLTIDNLAGAVVLMHDQVAYYYYAAALPEGKKQLLPYSVVWELMKVAKKRGCKGWDFEGIFDPRWPNKSILGYSHFKKSFDGQEISFPGSFTRWF